MKFVITHQSSYSRGELLLKTLFGIFYIGIPHAFVLFFLQIGLIFVNIGRFWIILFTGKWPKGMFDYAVKLQRYGIRVSSRLLNLCDGYPDFGLNGKDNKTDFNIEHKESYSRWRMIGRGIFGPLLIFPHFFILFFKQIAVILVRIIAWWAILITGKYPKGIHHFVVGVLRHSQRIGNYLYFLVDGYPSFSNSPVNGEITQMDQNGNSHYMGFSDSDILDMKGY
jgi:hypothetical protein